MPCPMMCWLGVERYQRVLYFDGCICNVDEINYRCACSMVPSKKKTALSISRRVRFETKPLFVVHVVMIGVVIREN